MFSDDDEDDKLAAALNDAPMRSRSQSSISFVDLVDHVTKRHDQMDEIRRSRNTDTDRIQEIRDDEPVRNPSMREDGRCQKCNKAINIETELEKSLDRYTVMPHARQDIAFCNVLRKEIEEGINTKEWTCEDCLYPKH